MAPSAIVQAGAQFSVPEAEAGDAVTLTAGPVNIGGAVSGAIANSITLAAGLSPTGYAGLQWNSTTRVLSWETPSLASRGSDLKTITLQVADAGALTATLTSNEASGAASIVRTFPEEVTITPENPDSSCKVSGQPVVAAAPTPPEGVTLAFANTVGFRVIDCDRNPNSTYPETLVVTIDVEQAIPEGTELYKVTDAGDWNVIEDAVIGVQSVTYSITDDGDLDLDKTPGTLRVAFNLRLKISFFGKHSIFIPPFDRILHRLGGIPIERSTKHGLVDAMASKMREAESMVLCLSPEGTRSPISPWKTGFLHIAHKANVPVFLVAFNYKKKLIEFGPLHNIGDNTQYELNKIYLHFKYVQGKYPEKMITKIVPLVEREIEK